MVEVAHVTMVLERKQIHENARQMCWTKILVKKIGKMENASSGRT